MDSKVLLLLYFVKDQVSENGRYTEDFFWTRVPQREGKKEVETRAEERRNSASF